MTDDVYDDGVGTRKLLDDHDYETQQFNTASYGAPVEDVAPFTVFKKPGNTT